MKAIKFVMMLLLASLALHISAQQLSIQWAQRFGCEGWDYVSDMVVTPKGNYMLGGSLKGILPGDTSSAGSEFSNNAYLAACDSNGHILWQKTFGGKLFENITSMASTSQGILISGIFQDTLRFDNKSATTTAYSGAYLVMVDEKGIPSWLRKTGGPATIKQIMVCSNQKGQAYMAGIFADSLQLGGVKTTKRGEKGFFLSALLPDGSETMPLLFKSSGNCTLGGICCNDSLVCLAGSFSDTLHINDTALVSFGGEDSFIAIFNFNGKLKFLITATGIGNEQVRSVAFSPTGDICMTGNFDYSVLIQNMILSSNGGKDIFVGVINKAGKLKWIKNIGGIGDDYGYTLTTNCTNDLFVSGNFVRNINMPDENGNIVEMDAGSAFGNAFIAKYNSDGDLKASYNLPATSEDYCQSIIADGNGMITTAGNFYQSIKLKGLGGLTGDLISQGERDVFLLRFKDLCRNVTVDAGPDTVLCPDQNVCLTSKEWYPYFKWMPGGKPNRDLIVTKPGIYTLLITDKNGCIASDSLLIKLLELPKIVAGNDTTIAAGENLFLAKASASDANSVEWNTRGTGCFGNSSLLSTYYSPSYEDISNGSVLLSLAASNRCTSTDDNILLTIKQDDDGITAYPNPTHGLVTLVCTKGITVKKASLTTQSGFVLQSNIKVNGTVMQYNLSHYPPGTFLFHLITDKTTVTKVINKQ